MNDEQIMRIALELAKQALPSPNPRVGCIITRDGKIIASGCHKKAGEPHAEINALASLNPQDAASAKMYVTLEPCSHEGKGKRTGACTKAIIASGIRHVICASKDANPKVSGIEELRKHGIRVDLGILEKEAMKLNEAHMKYVSKGTPFLTLKAGLTLDGKIATPTGESKWISGVESLDFCHNLRSESDALMVGIGTVLKDNPRLTARPGGEESARQPVKIVIDGMLRISPSARLFRNKARVIIATSEKCPKIKMRKLGKKSEVIICGKALVDLKKLMRILAKKGITSILMEGGSELNGALLRQRLIDKFYFFYAPKIIGGKDSIPVIGGSGVKKLKEAIKASETKVSRIGDDILVEGYLEY